MPLSGQALRDLSADDWRADIEFVRDSLASWHPDLYRHVDKQTLEAAYERTLRAAAETPSISMPVQLSRVLALVNDAHTEIGLTQGATGYGRLPLAVRFFDDGLYVIGADSASVDLIGHRLVSVEGTPVAEVQRRLEEIIAADNSAEYLHEIPRQIVIPEILFGIGVSSSPDETQLTFTDGATTQITTIGRIPADSVDALLIDAPQLSGWERVPRYRLYWRPGIAQIRFYWYDYLPDHRTVYFQINRTIDESESSTVSQIIEDLFSFVDEQPVDRVILDLRNNRGGNYDLSKSFVEGVRARSWLRERGALVVITGPSTFSAATILTAQLLEVAGVTIVGSPSRGDPNGSDNAEIVRLPRSRLILQYTDRLREHLPALKPERQIPVDLPVRETFPDYQAGRDPVLSAVLELPAPSRRP